MIFLSENQHRGSTLSLGFLLMPMPDHSTSRMRSRTFLFLLPLLCFFPGCEKTDLGVIDSRGLPVFLHSAAVTPDIVNMSKLPSINGVLTVTFDIRLAVDLAGNAPLAAVQAEVFAPITYASLAQVALHPDGTTTGAGYRTYSGRIQFGVSKSDAGGYLLRFQALTPNGLQTNTLDRTIAIVRNNSAPRLSQLTAPDSATLPQSGSLLVFMTVAVSDSDGAGDIREVYFRSLDSSNPNQKLFMLDDGGLTTTPSSGDKDAADGIYSITVQLPSTTTRKIYHFAFQAVDAFGDTSNTVLHQLTVR